MIVHTMGAIIEGVEVRSPHWLVGVCRRSDGLLVAARVSVAPMDAGAGAWPFIRGIVCQLRQWYPPASLRNWSISLAEQNGSVTEFASRGPVYRGPPAEHDIVAREELRGAPGKLSAGSLVAALLWATIWMGVPQVLVGGVLALAGVDSALISLEYQIATAVLQLGLTIAYMYAIGRSVQVQRLFQYNTAALKVLVAHEARAPLTVDAVRRQSPSHPNSSANYIGIVHMLLPAVFYLAGRPLVGFAGTRLSLHATFIALKLASLPLVLALSYEVQRIAVRLFQAGRVRGVWPVACALQRAVSKEPDDEQIEVAVLAVREALLLEAEMGSNVGA